MSFTPSERVKMLRAQKWSDQRIAESMGMTVADVRFAAGDVPKKKGRPSSEGRCQHCGASPANQRVRQ